MNLDAYYYGFEATDVKQVDRILSAVANAGDAYHHTEYWRDETRPYEEFLRGDCPADWIENAAKDAAAYISALEDRLRQNGVQIPKMEDER